MWMAALTTPILTISMSLLISERPQISEEFLERAAYQVWYNRTKSACFEYRGQLEVIWDRRSRSATAECVVNSKVRLIFDGFQSTRVRRH